MTAAEFEKDVAREHYGLTVEKFRELGFRITSCPCGGEDCPGWIPCHPQAEQAHALERLAGLATDFMNELTALTNALPILLAGPFAESFRSVIQKATSREKDPLQ